MRIIKVSFLHAAVDRHPKAKKWITTWYATTRNADWKNLQDVRRSYPAADVVRVKSGKNVVVFNACGNDFRLVVALHYNRGIAYTLRFFTHAEYSKEKWKQEL